MNDDRGGKSLEKSVPPRKPLGRIWVGRRGKKHFFRKKGNAGKSSVIEQRQKSKWGARAVQTYALKGGVSRKRFPTQYYGDLLRI